MRLSSANRCLGRARGTRVRADRVWHDLPRLPGGAYSGRHATTLIPEDPTCLRCGPSRPAARRPQLGLRLRRASGTHFTDPQRKSCPILSQRVFRAFRTRSVGLWRKESSQRATHRTALLSRSAVAPRLIGHRAQGCSCWPDQTTENGRRSSRTGCRGVHLSAAGSLRGGTRRETMIPARGGLTRDVRRGVAPRAQDLGRCREPTDLPQAVGVRGRRPMAQPAFEPKPREAVVRHAGRCWVRRDCLCTMRGICCGCVWTRGHSGRQGASVPRRARPRSTCDERVSPDGLDDGGADGRCGLQVPGAHPLIS